MASTSNHPPCAGCKFLRRKCLPECDFAPYFPPNQTAKFAGVHRVFGASNVAKLLGELQPHQREDAVNSLSYEAEMRLRDPVHGCVGVISLLRHRLCSLQMDLSCAKSELSRYQIHLLSGGLTAESGFHRQFFPTGRQHQGFITNGNGACSSFNGMDMSTGAAGAAATDGSRTAVAPP